MTKISKKIAKVPNLRFPEFSEEWKEITLGDCSLSLDYGMNAAATNFDGINRYIRITDIDDISSKYKSDSPVSPTGELEDKYLVKENDILFARTGASTGKSYLYKPDDGKLYFAGFLIRVKIDSNYYNANFIFNQTKTVSYNKWVKLMSMRSGQPGINSQEYASFKFGVPLKSEQNKIASFLSLIDERIQTQSKVIEELKLLKVTLRNKLFEQLVNEENELMLMKDILEYEQPVKYLVSNTDYFSDDSLIPVLTANKAFILGYTDENSGIYDKGDCIIFDDFTMDLKYVDFPFKVKSSAIKILKPKPKVNLRFVFEYLSFLNFQSNEHKRHYISEIEPMRIALPNTKMQDSIAIFLSLIDEKTEIEVSTLKLLTRQKRWLLQNLFI